MPSCIFVSARNLAIVFRLLTRPRWYQYHGACKKAISVSEQGFTCITMRKIGMIYFSFIACACVYVCVHLSQEHILMDALAHKHTHTFTHTHKHTRTNMVPSLWFTLLFNGNPINDLICFRHKYWPLQQDQMKYVVPKRQSVRDSNWCTIPPFCWTFPLICRVFNHRGIYRTVLSEL